MNHLIAFGVQLKREDEGWKNWSEHIPRASTSHQPQGCDTENDNGGETQFQWEQGPRGGRRTGLLRAQWNQMLR